LQGLYAPRSQNTEPSGRDPGPLDFNVNDPKRAGPMGERLPREQMDPNWQVVENPAETVLSGIIATNKRYGKNR
jgi:hypothetical protein